MKRTNYKINNKTLLNSHYYLKNKTIDEIKKAQFNATQQVFKKKIPFRSFLISKRNEETLGNYLLFLFWKQFYW